MDLLQTGASLFLFLLYCVSAKIVQNGAEVEIKCKPTGDAMVLWFRTRDGKAEFIASYSGGIKKNSNTDLGSKFSDVKNNVLRLSNFDKNTDSGMYSCASVNNNQLIFGDVTVLEGEPDPKPTEKPVPKAATVAQQQSTAKTPPPCEPKRNEKNNRDSSLPCEIWILGSLAGGCGFLLIVLILTILYCNHTRTRYCPHHHKKRPQHRAEGHKPLPNQHVF